MKRAPVDAEECPSDQLESWSSPAIAPIGVLLSSNKDTVQKYIDGFNRSNHEQILSCLTDDVEWHMPTAFG